MSEELERVEPPLNLMEQLSQVEEAGILSLKGYKNSEIAQVLNITPRAAREYVQEYMSIIQTQVDNDPHFMERIGFNTMKAVKELDELSKEAWETVNIATNEGMVTARVQSLKLALEISTKKAQLHQLLGTGQRSSDSGLMERTQRAEGVNQLLSGVIREVVADCERCRERTRVALAEAFTMMETEPVDVEVVDNE
jgi:hypothetical protein